MAYFPQWLHVLYIYTMNEHEHYEHYEMFARKVVVISRTIAGNGKNSRLSNVRFNFPMGNCHKPVTNYLFFNFLYWYNQPEILTHFPGNKIQNIATCFKGRISLKYFQPDP